MYVCEGFNTAWNLRPPPSSCKQTSVLTREQTSVLIHTHQSGHSKHKMRTGK